MMSTATTAAIIKHMRDNVAYIITILEGIPQEQRTPPLQHLMENLSSALDQYDKAGANSS